MKCRNCGEEGPHFVPPCMGDPGFFTCEPKDVCKTCNQDDPKLLKIRK